MATRIRENRSAVFKSSIFANHSAFTFGSGRSTVARRAAAWPLSDLSRASSVSISAALPG